MIRVMIGFTNPECSRPATTPADVSGWTGSVWFQDFDLTSQAGGVDILIFSSLHLFY